MAITELARTVTILALASEKRSDEARVDQETLRIGLEQVKNRLTRLDRKVSQ